MSLLFGMWYGRAFPTYHGLQSMSVLMSFRSRTARLYDFAVIAPLMLSRACVANFASMKPIWAKPAGRSLGEYFLDLEHQRRVGPDDGSTLLNS